MIITLAAFFATLASAQKPMESLLRVRSRPTVHQVLQSGVTLADLPGKPDTLLGYGLGWPSLWIYRTLQDGPELIAGIEKSFPGAKIAVIGRDAALTGDILETFYAGLGQHSRVIWLGVSRTSFGQYDPQSLLGFLQQQGLDPSQFQYGPPWLLLDTVSRGGGRQGRLILDALRNELARKGVPRPELFRRLNMIGLEVSTYSAQSFPIGESDRLIQRQIQGPTTGGPEVPFLTFRSKWNQVEGQPGFGEIGYEHFTGAWHGPHGAFQRVGDRWETPPLNYVSIETQQVVIAYQLLLARVVNSRIFADRVAALLPGTNMAESLRERVSIPLPLATAEWKTTLRPWPGEASQIEAAARLILDQFFAKNPTGDTILETAPEAVRTLCNYSQFGDRLLLPLLEGIAQHLEKGKHISALDLGFILSTLVGHGEIRTDTVAGIVRIASQHPKLRGVLKPEILELFFQFPHQVGPIRDLNASLPLEGAPGKCGGNLT